MSQLLKNPQIKKSIIHLYKLAVTVSAFSMAFLLIEMVRMSFAGSTSVIVFGDILTHHQATICLGWATFIHIVLIKTGVSLKEGGAKHDRTFFVHLVFAILFTFSVIFLCSWYKETQAFHAPLTYFAAFCFSIVMSIGLPMLFKRF